LNRWLLNFDVRVAKEQYVSRRWDRDSRTEFLLRPDIEWPLSVDRSVWPSVFFSNGFRDFRDEDATIGIDPQLEGTSGPTSWQDLDRMRAHYDAHGALAPGGVFVAIELLSERTAEGPLIPYELPGGIQCGIWLDPTVPDRIPEGSTLLGYDVADDGRISGLSNCGYTEGEVRAMGPVWADRLNSFGLLSTLEDAVAFRQQCDQRVPEHAPFWVYTLWRLRIATTS
jgi:hypothetical protein